MTLATTRRAQLGTMALAPIAGAAIASPIAAASPDRVAWDRALAAARAARANVLAMEKNMAAVSEAAFTSAVAEMAELEDELIAMPVPSIGALSEKMEIVKASYADSVIDEHVIDSIAADARRLSTREG